MHEHVTNEIMYHVYVMLFEGGLKTEQKTIVSE
jgi:hypothetical protein